MAEKRPLTLAAPSQHLLHLVTIRWLLTFCLGVTTWSLAWLTAATLPYIAMSVILVFFAGVNCLTFFRLKKDVPVTDVEFFFQLMFDLACLSALFYFSGGANNPFISYFLVPICISAATLPWVYTWFIAVLCISSYTLLLFFHVSLPILSPVEGHAHHAEINLHILGMWVNFFISAALITYFVVKMAKDLRHQNDLLNQRREDDLRDEQLMAVATLAAGTAHELGTPLSTMKVLLSELQEEYQHQPTLQQDLKLLSDQVQQCAQTLKQLVGKAEHGRDGAFTPLPLDTFCTSIIERWKIMRPEVSSFIIFNPDSPAVNCALHPTIAQSIINLLNNAADANPADIQVTIEWNQQTMHWRIEDKGSGIPMEIANQLGKPFVTTKGKGLGLGLFLSHATINRYGGSVCLYNRKPHGTLTEVILPLSPNRNERTL